MARRRRARKAARNPSRRKRGRRLKRNLRRNPGSGAFARADAGLFSSAAAAPKKARKKHRRLSAKARRRRATSRGLMRKASALRKRARSLPRRSLRRSVAMTQAKRLTTLRKVVARGGSAKKSAVAKAMHIRSNPGLSGLVVAAKALAPQVAAGAVAMVGLAMLGRKLSDMLTTTVDQVKVAEAAATTPAAVVVTPAAPAAGPTAGLGAVRDAFLDAEKKPKAIVKYMPAISTGLVTVGGYWLANKFAPKYKGAVVMGGMLAAVLQAVVAASAGKTDGLAAKAVKAVGLGDYTTVGGRSYAEAGIFRDIGDYTTVGGLGTTSIARGGGAYSNSRPRNTSDNRTEWAVNGLGEPSSLRSGGAYSNQRPRNSRDNSTEWSVNGLDDTTEWAPGEGGLLAGGMFRGPSQR